MIHARIELTRPLDTASLAAALASHFRLKAETFVSDGEICAELGRWGLVRIARCPEGYAITAAPSASPFAASVALAAVAAAAGSVLDGRAELERLALHGPVVSSDAEARAALDALRGGDTSQAAPLERYIRCFPHHFAVDLAGPLGDWATEASLRPDRVAVDAARIMVALGMFRKGTVRHPEARAVFDAQAEEWALFRRER